MTSRIEFEPMSMTAIGGPFASRPWAGTAQPARADRLRAAALTNEAAGRGIFERFATARQARIGHEVLVGVERFLARGRLYAHRGAIGQELPALLVVVEVRHHDLVEHLLVDRRIENRAQRLDPSVEVARHHVGRGDVDRGLRVRQAMAAAEAIDAAVFEKTADDRLYADAFR